MSQDTKHKLNIQRTILIGLAFFTITMFWEVYDSIMPLFLMDFNLSSFQTGVVMALDNILALVLLPFMGLFSDRFPQKLRSKLGRRMPFIVAGSVLASVTFCVLNFAHNTNNLILMLVVTAFTLVFMCLYRTPAVSLMPDVTPKPMRSKANAIINIMGTVGGIITLVLMTFLLQKTEVDFVNGMAVYNLVGNNWILVGIISSLMVLSSLVMVFKVKENKFAEECTQIQTELGLTSDEEDKIVEDGIKAELKKEKISPFAHMTRGQVASFFFLLLSVFLWYMAYNGAKTHFSVFALTTIGEPNFTLPLLLANASAFVMFMPASMIANKLGRKKTILLGVILLTLGFGLGAVSLFFAPAIIKVAMYIAFLLIGAGWATINVHSYVMSVEMATDKTIGTFTGIYYTFSMSAQIITPVLAGLVMDIDSRFLLVYCAVFSALAFLTMLFVRHGNVGGGDSEPTKEQTILSENENA